MSAPGGAGEEPPAPPDGERRLLRRLVGYLRPYRWQVAASLLLLFSGAALELAGPYLTRLALDRAIPAGDTALLGRLIAIYLAAMALAFAAEYLHTLLGAWLGQTVMFDLRTRLFAHLQRLSLRYFDRNPVGRLMTRVTHDVEQLNEAFSSGLVTIFGDLFTLLFILGVMIHLDWRLALVTFTVLPLVAAAAFLFRGLIRRAYREIRVRLARINAFVQEHVSGVRVVQLFGREAAVLGRFRRVNDDHLQAHLRSIRYYALFFPVVEVLTAVALALILWHGGGRPSAGRRRWA